MPTFFPKKAVSFARQDPLARRIKPVTVYNNIVSNEDELDPNLSRLRKI